MFNTILTNTYLFVLGNKRDLLSSEYMTAVKLVMESGTAVLTGTKLIPDYSNPEQLSDDKALADWLQNYLKPGVEAFEPLTTIFYPVIDNVETVKVDDNENVGKKQVVGCLSLTLYWRDLIKSILPRGSNGIIVVFENPCNPTFTYQIVSRSNVKV